MEVLTHSAVGTSTAYGAHGAYGMTGPVLRRGRRRAIARWAPAWLALSLWLSLLPVASELNAQAPDNLLEYQVKAAFLLNFAKFVEWPAAAFRAFDAPVTICVAGDDPFGAILDRTVEGELVNNRAVKAQRLLPDGDLRSCHILFISRSERERFAEIVSRLRGSSVLTVSELPGFVDAGGMIEFIVEEGKARFYINAATAAAGGLRLSSRLLRVAKEVRGS